MKLVVAGSTGFVGTELVRQALSHPAITTLVALGRRPTPIPDNLGPQVNIAKLKSVVCEDFEHYSDAVKEDLADADACIWLVAITPSKRSSVSTEQLEKICFGYTMTGLKTMVQLSKHTSTNPFRFIYTSGAMTVTDQIKKPWILGDYTLLRGRVESEVLEFGKNPENTNVQTCVTKPGLILAEGRRGLITRVASSIMCRLIGLSQVKVEEVAATMLDQAINGIEKETLLNDDLARIGQKVLSQDAGHY